MSIPLGNFQQDDPLDSRVLAKAQALYEALPPVPKGGITRLYLHWTVSSYNVTFEDYNGAAYIGDSWAMKMTCDPNKNIYPGRSEASHTWHRNTGAVGVAISAMGGASMGDFGPYPVTNSGLECLCACAAAFCLRCGIDAAGTVAAPGSNHQGDNGNVNTTGEPNILTHAEAADRDGYMCGFTSDPDCRWDLALFTPLTGGEFTREMANICGDALRRRVHLYKAALTE